MIALETLLDVTARAHGLDAGRLRNPHDGGAREAREAFCWLARGLIGLEPAAAGLAVGLTAEAAEAASESVAGRLNDGRDLADRLFLIEVEVRALERLSDRIAMKRVEAIHPFEVAKTLCRSKRDAMTVTVDELMAVGAALIALQAARPRGDVVAAATRLIAAEAAAAEARFTIEEKPAARSRAAAMNDLKALIGA